MFLKNEVAHWRYLVPGSHGGLTMNVIERVLGSIDGGSVLDVATHQGGFTRLLMEHLRSYTTILGVDTNERAIETAQRTNEKEGVRFQVMDAARLEFEDRCFDTACISASLHHLQNPPLVLQEMTRVLKPDGHFVLVEMHCDGQTEAQLTFVYLHHWLAEVDSALGILHHHTLARQDFVDYVAGLGLSAIELYDHVDHDTDPMDPDRIGLLDDLIERTVKRAEGTSDCRALIERGEALRQRLYEVGAQSEPVLLVLGTK